MAPLASAPKSLFPKHKKCRAPLPPPSFDPLLDPSRPSFSDRLFDARYARPQPAPGSLWSSPPSGAKPRRRDGPPSRTAAATASAKRKLKGAALLGVGVGGGAAALAGWGLLAALVLTRTLAPPAATLSRDLWVDYTASPAVAAVSFLPDGGAPPVVTGKGSGGDKTPAPSVRAFGAGRRVDVWLTLEAPDAPAGGDGTSSASADVVQVRAELLGADGRVLAATSRPALLPYRSRAVRALRAALRAPLVVAGLAGEMQALALPLFVGYRDVPDAPAVGLRVALAGRPARGSSSGGADPPPLHSLRAHARQRLGWIIGVLYLLRPRDAVAFPLYALSVVAIAAGTLAAALAIVLAVTTGGGEGDNEAPPPRGLLGWVARVLVARRAGDATPPPSPGPSGGSAPSYDLSPSSASVSASVGSDDGEYAAPRALEEEEEEEDDEWAPIAAVPSAHAADAAAAIAAAASPASLASPPDSPAMPGVARTLSGARTIAPAEGAALAEGAAETLRRRRVGEG